MTSVNYVHLQSLLRKFLVENGQHSGRESRELNRELSLKTAVTCKDLVIKNPCSKPAQEKGAETSADMALQPRPASSLLPSAAESTGQAGWAPTGANAGWICLSPNNPTRGDVRQLGIPARPHHSKGKA